MNGFEEHTTMTAKAKAWIDAVLGMLSNTSTKDRPILAIRLENRWNLSSAEVRMVIKHLRRNGCPIGSSSKGYFWASNESELQSTIKHLDSRAESLQATSHALKTIKWS